MAVEVFGGCVGGCAGGGPGPGVFDEGGGAEVEEDCVGGLVIAFVRGRMGRGGWRMMGGGEEDYVFWFDVVVDYVAS